MALFGQHGACGLPLVLARVESREQIHDEIGKYVARIEIWECPCGCSQFEREGRTAVEGNIG